MRKPLAIDLFCGLGGWTEGFLAEGFNVIGFDIEQHRYGDARYPAQLVVQDILTLHGSQFRKAAVIVASPPCQEYSYMAMPWKLAKAKAAAIRADTSGQELADLNRLFDACFRIQKEASIAAGHHIPMVVENVRGAIPWVGRSRWNFGSFHLWGDVPALMPMTLRSQDMKVGDAGWRERGPGRQFQDRAIKKMEKNSTEFTGVKAPGMNWSDPTKRGQDFTRIAGSHAMNGDDPNGRKGSGGSWFYEYGPGQGTRNFNSKSLGRKMASAMIAKIPLPLSRHIAATFRP